MNSADASEAARALSRAQWGDSAIRRAVTVLRERREDISAATLAELREIVGVPARDGDDAR